MLHKRLAVLALEPHNWLVSVQNTMGLEQKPGNFALVVHMMIVAFWVQGHCK